MSQRGAAIAMISAVPITLSHRYTSQCSRLCLYRDTKQCKPNVGPKKKKSIKQCRVHNAKTMQSHRKPTRVYISHVVDLCQAIYHLPQSKAHGDFFFYCNFFAFKDANETIGSNSGAIDSVALLDCWYIGKFRVYYVF